MRRIVRRKREGEGEDSKGERGGREREDSKGEEGEREGRESKIKEK